MGLQGILFWVEGDADRATGSGVLPGTWRSHTAVGRLSQSRLCVLGDAFQVLHPLVPWELSDHSNQPEANPIRMETGPGPRNEIAYRSN